MAGFIGGRTSAFDYIGPDLPNNPQNGEMWFDTDGASDGSGEVKVYDGADDAWEATGFTSHADLTDVTRSAHHPPVDVSGPLTQPSDQSLGLSIGDGLADSSGTLVAALGNGLGIDSNGQVYVPASAVEQSMLAFNTATQAELDGHAGDTTNPHNVTDDQTGAASALSNHASDPDRHHTRYSDSEARSATDGQIDADTVDGQHASELAAEVNTWSRKFSVSALAGTSSDSWSFSSPPAVTYVRINVGGYGEGDVDFQLDDGTTWSKTGIGNSGGSGSAEKVYHYLPDLHGHRVTGLDITHTDEGDASSSSTTVRMVGIHT